MDLNELKAKKDFEIDVPLMFDDSGKAVSGFKVVGINSRQYQQANREWALMSVKKSAVRGRGIDAKTDSGATELIDGIAAREFAIAKACIVGIYGFTSGGKDVELTDDTLTAIFDARPTWRTKVVAVIETEQVFTTA